MNETIKALDEKFTSGNSIDVERATITRDEYLELRRLHEVNQELVEALREIADWTDRYTTAGHPISTVARAAIAKAEGESNE